MTTIAIKDGVVAVDRAGSVSGWRQPQDFEKYLTFPCAVLVGSGAYGAVQEAFRYYQKHKTLLGLNLAEDTRVLVCKEDGNPWVSEPEGWFQLGDAEFYAFGSGSPAAWGAMAAGATAKEAVEIAARFDPDTGGVVDAIHYASVAA